MPARKIKVVDVINAIEDHAVEEHVPVPNDTDAGLRPEPDVKAIENEPIEAIPSGADREVEVEEETTHPQHEPEIPNQPLKGQGQTPVSSVKTVELVECPDCNKKMTKKTLKYSHAKNCTGKKVVPAVKEEEAEESPPCGKEEVIPSTPPQQAIPMAQAQGLAKLKRTVSVVPAEKTPVKKTINKVRRDIATEGQVEQQSHTPGASAGVDQRVTVKGPIGTVANIYGRENRNERVKQKTEKMGKLFVNAI